MSETVRTRAPKRKITRVRSRIDHIITAAQLNSILHTSEDPETLVRTIVDLQLMGTTAIDVDVDDFDLLIHVAPSGTKTASPVITELLDTAENINTLFRSTPQVRIGASGNTLMEIKADLRNMRKLRELDTIVLSTIASSDSKYWLKGYIIQFFKE